MISDKAKKYLAVNGCAWSKDHVQDVYDDFLDDEVGVHERRRLQEEDDEKYAKGFIQWCKDFDWEDIDGSYYTSQDIEDAENS